MTEEQFEALVNLIEGLTQFTSSPIVWATSRIEAIEAAREVLVTKE